jgi:hypothetical protein
MDEKKKMMILAGLAVMMLGIGAFTFMPKGEEPKPTEAKKDKSFLEKNAEALLAAENAPVNPLVANPLQARDPFKVPDAMSEPNLVVTQPNGAQPTVLKEPRKGLKGDIRLANRNTGELNIDPVPQPGYGEVKPAEVDIPFNYTIGGVAVGSKSAVVFRDIQGNQRLVLQGGMLDGDTQVKAVAMDHVVVVFHGKTIKLPVGDKPVKGEGPTGK